MLPQPRRCTKHLSESPRCLARSCGKSREYPSTCLNTRAAGPPERHKGSWTNGDVPVQRRGPRSACLTRLAGRCGPRGPHSSTGSAGRGGAGSSLPWRGRRQPSSGRSLPGVFPVSCGTLPPSGRRPRAGPSGPAPPGLAASAPTWPPSRGPGGLGAAAPRSSRAERWLWAGKAPQPREVGAGPGCPWGEGPGSRRRAAPWAGGSPLRCRGAPSRAEGARKAAPRQSPSPPTPWQDWLLVLNSFLLVFWPFNWRLDYLGDNSHCLLKYLHLLMTILI